MKKVWQKFEQKYLKLKKAKLVEEVGATKRFFELKGKYYLEFPDGLIIQLVPAEIPSTESYKSRRAKKKWTKK